LKFTSRYCRRWGITLCIFQKCRSSPGFQNEQAMRQRNLQSGTHLLKGQRSINCSSKSFSRLTWHSAYSRVKKSNCGNYATSREITLFSLRSRPRCWKQANHFSSAILSGIWYFTLGWDLTKHKLSRQFSDCLRKKDGGAYCSKGLV
jgi:hypothetical protein